MNSETTLVTENIGHSLGGIARQARFRLTIVAPFIQRNALEQLISGVAPSVALTIFTRWKVEEIIAGVSDLTVFDLLCDRVGSQMLLCPRLHAKVLLIDDQIAAIGSANITDAAMGFAVQPNAEVMAILHPVPNRLFQFLLHLERDAIVATEKLRQKFEEAVKTVPAPPEYPVVPLPALPPRIAGDPFPRFRSPERLYIGYISVVEFSDQETRAAVLCDLATLALPDGLDEPEFRQRVGTALLADGMVSAFDEFVARPRYFGEMAEWLKDKGVLAGREQEERKRYLQTLIRWLRHFLPSRYRLEEPRYSELFGRAMGWDIAGPLAAESSGAAETHQNKVPDGDGAQGGE